MRSAKLERQRRLAAGGRPGYQDRVPDPALALCRISFMPLVATLISHPAARALTPAAREYGVACGRRKRVALAGRRHRLRPGAARGLGKRRGSTRTCAQRWPATPSTSSSSDAARTAQEDPDRRHGFDHDRPGMHRRTGRRGRAEGPRRRDHRALDERRDRLRAGAARTRGAAEGPRRRRHRPHHRQPPDAGLRRPRAGAHHARATAPGRRWSPAASRLHRAASPRCSASTRTAPTA